jgi:hypothetical protein
MKYIFGSGIIALLAREILGPSWKLVPFYRSRFFSFQPALDDNYIIRHARLDEFIANLTGNRQQHLYKRAWSVGGELISSYSDDLRDAWLSKVYGTQVLPQVRATFNKNMAHFIYDLRTNHVYSALLAKYDAEINAEVAKGQVTAIGDHHFMRGAERVDFDEAISTIPLDSLCSLLGSKFKPEGKPVHFLHVETPNLDFEGHNQTLVVDPQFPFYKVTNVAPGRYLFYLHEEVPQPGAYLMALLSQFDILDGTSIHNYITMGAPPKLDWVNAAGITPIGSYAQWDPSLDVGTCLLRVMDYASKRGTI